MEETNIFFNPGDRVTLRQDIPNKPIMIVVNVDGLQQKVFYKKLFSLQKIFY